MRALVVWRGWSPRLLPAVLPALLPALLTACLPEPTKPDDGDGDGLSELDGDCDDADPAIFPGAVDLCGGVDDDCDGALDEDAPAEDLCGGGDEDCDGEVDEDALVELIYADADGDGHGAGEPLPPCGTATGVDSADDCDDGDAGTFPGATEVCGDGIDQNCDDQLDQDGMEPFYVDADGDGYGAAATMACPNGVGLSEIDGDCDDREPTIYPGATEECGDGVDQNCALDCRPVGDQSPEWAAEDPENNFFGTDAFPLTDQLYGFGVSDRGAGCSGSAIRLFTGPVVGNIPLSSNFYTLANVTTGSQFCGATEANGVLVAAEEDGDDSINDEILDRLILQQYGGLPYAQAILSVPHQSAAFGQSVENVGDLDGDGIDDVAVGTPYTEDDIGRGRVYILQSPTPVDLRDGDLSLVATWVLRGPRDQEALGRAITAGDWDRDGDNDLAISAPSTDSSDVSKVYLLGEDALEFEQPDQWMAVGYEGPQGDGFGFSLEAGDGDGDGVPELLIGAPFRDDATIGGSIYLVSSFGPGTMAISPANALVRGEGPGHHVGGAMAVLDIDGDGMDDLFASHGAYEGYYFGDSASEIGVTGYYGPAGTPTLHLTMPGSDWFGAWISGIGDVTGDDIGDLGIGDGGYGRLWIWSSPGE